MINYQEFYRDFMLTERGQLALAMYGTLSCTNNHRPSIVHLSDSYAITPRQLLGDNELVLTNPSRTTFSIVPFYYLDILFEKNPQVTYDLGCGWNQFKNFYPGIVGIDSHDTSADIQARWNRQFLEQHQGTWDSFFSINMSWHLGPNGEATTLDNFCQHIDSLAQLLAPGGRAYIALSMLGLIHFTPKEWYADQGIGPWPPGPLKQYIEQQLSALPYKIITMDVEADILHNMPDHDGEVRIIIESIL